MSDTASLLANRALFATSPEAKLRSIAAKARAVVQSSSSGSCRAAVIASLKTPSILHAEKLKLGHFQVLALLLINNKLHDVLLIVHQPVILKTAPRLAVIETADMVFGPARHAVPTYLNA